MTTNNLNSRLHALNKAMPQLTKGLKELIAYWTTHGTLPKTKLMAKGCGMQDQHPLKQALGEFITFNRAGDCRLNAHGLALACGGSETLIKLMASAFGLPIPKAKVEKVADVEEQGPEEIMDGLKCLPRYRQLEPGQTNQATKCLTYLLEPHPPLSYSHLGAELLGDSKAIRPGTWLWSICGAFLQEYFAGDLSYAEAFSKAGVFGNPTAIKVTLFGPFIYWKGQQRFSWIDELWKCGETATLSLDNLKGVTLIELPTSASPVITCENESPFYQLCRERPSCCTIYTEGFPNDAVKRVIGLLEKSVYTVKHWGDTDVDGWRIAEQICQLAPISLYRCDLKETKRLEERLKPMGSEKRKRAKQLLLNQPCFPFRKELEFAINHGWLEQESWHEETRD